MELLREEKDYLGKDDILKWIADYEENQVPILSDCKKYSRGENPYIVTKVKKDKASSPNNPATLCIVSYGRKLITTFKGYGYRPQYITYTVEEKTDQKYLDQLIEDFNKNNEHIKTNINGGNTGIYGMSYELVYIDGESKTADLRFVPIEPQECILLYDNDAEPNVKIAIRFVKVSKLKYLVTVYYNDSIEEYIRTREYEGATSWKLEQTEVKDNFFGEVPIIAYYLDEDMQGIILPIHYLIDMLDALVSGNMDEFERFANSYLRLVGIGLDDPIRQKGSGLISMLQDLKRRRVFQRLQDKDDVTFLTKDLPTEFMQMMYNILKEQIHKQSHIPDMDDRELSGIAVQRMMFDFENVISTAEAYFDVGLFRRIELMNKIYAIRGMEVRDPSIIDINHKRNMPLNIKEFAEAALKMKQGGFSREAILHNMPEDMIPDKEMELKRQIKERDELMTPFDNIEDGDNAKGGNNGKEKEL